MMGAVAGIGVDIVEIERFKNTLQKHPRVLNRLFTPKEQQYCLSRKISYRHFAVRFATKEAVLKAFGTGRRGVGWKDVEVVRMESGSPQIELHNSALDLINAKGIKEVKVSLSFSHNSAIAMAVAVHHPSS
jgi:holo-[acyl-carrier protein] synthase